MDSTRSPYWSAAINLTMKPSSRMLLSIARLLPRGYWPIIRAAANRDSSLQDMSIELRGISQPLRADLRESVFVPLYRCGQIPHQIGFDTLCRRVLRDGDTVFDVGANVGYTAALFSDLVGGHGRVLAIEPSPRAFFLLSRSLSDIGNIALLNVGVSSCEGDLALSVPPMLDRASIVPIAGAEQITIRAVTLDSLVATYGQPQVVKVDVEGHEPDVFAGGATTLEREDRPLVVFEALDANALSQCVDTLQELSVNGYRFMRIRNDGVLIPSDGTGGSSDYVAIPRWADSRLLSDTE